MARSKKPAKKRASSSRNVTLAPDKFRSLVLDKLRADIEVKRAALELAKRIPIKDLGSMGYWMKAYWMKAYWKMRSQDFGIDEVINPVMPIVGAVAAARKKRVR